MPIKLPKAFPRRKSSGNALEEVENPPEPSFRVFEPSGHKSFDGGNSLKRMSQALPMSAGFRSDENIYNDRPNVNPINRYVMNVRSSNSLVLTQSRGSGGTNNSASSKYDNSSSSARYSSSSTLPSSTDILLDDGPSPHPKDSDNIPIPATPSSNPLSFRAGGRSFSFGRKKAQTSSNAPPPLQHVSDSPGYTPVTRERALTESSYASGSTATPPKFLDTGLDFGPSDLDGFGSMFDHLGKRTSQTQAHQIALDVPRTESPVRPPNCRIGPRFLSDIIQENMSPAGSRMLTKPYSDRTANTPSPVNIDRTRESGSSPYSHSSRNSQEGLMASTSPAVPDATFSYEDGHTVQTYNRRTHLQTMPIAHTSSPSSRPRQAGPRPITGLRRTSAHVTKRDSMPLQDEDARLVLDSMRASQRLNRSSGDFDSYIDSYRDSYREDDEGFVRQSTTSPARSPALPPGHSTSGKEAQRTPIELYDGPYRDRRMDSAETTPRARKLDMAQPEEERSLFDKSPPRPGQLPPPPRKPLAPASAGSQNKIMTPAEFERYRKEQESLHRAKDASNSDGSDDESYDYDDDDEEERKKQLAKERRKQEAHLAVYRQQMMKVTGEQPSDLPSLRPGLEKAQIAPTGRAQTPTFTLDRPSDSTKASDDEDDEVPLGILAAHGFPAKNRPPTVSMSNPNIKYQSESYPPPPLSSAGASTGGRPLPPFAKHLPPDPYFGAGLVNSSTRESLGFNHASAGSAYGGSQGPAHPAGLVGVIAGEERARAARRGSPSAQAGFGNSMPQGMMPPTMGMPAMLSPGDEAQIHMSQQMTQMMQMQMQWMQQMQAMMASGMHPPMAPPHMQMPGGNGMLSPQMQQMQQQQQQMGNGMLSPGQMLRPVSHSAPGSPAAIPSTGPRAMSMMTPTAPPQWGRQSTAPSMMSGALNPDQQRGYAPSMAPSERSNVGMPSRYRPVSIPPIDEGSRPGSSMSMSTAGKLNSTGRPPIKKVSNEDDDEEGWEEMKKKRDAKKSNWRNKKGGKPGVGLEGIYFPEQ